VKLDLNGSVDLRKLESYSEMTRKAIKRGVGGTKEVEALEKNKAATFDSV
jgi:hypothetical protein